ncbi:MAG: hypothetical protein KGH79_05245 [Patescibacteria group bacterium]|nr:hypothetical protein [Patescibacteria group bacterium]
MNKYLIISLLVVVVLAAAGYYGYQHTKVPAYTTAMVQRGPITQEVYASGNVAAPSTIDLKFQTSGRLTSVGVAVGDKVSAGETVAEEDTSVLTAQP